MDIGPLSTFFNSEAVNRFRHHLIREFLAVAGGAAVMFSLRVAGIAGVMAVVASMSVMAQTTGTISAPSANLPASVAAADRKPVLVQ